MMNIPRLALLLLLLLLLCGAGRGFAQKQGQARIDSLLAALPAQREDTAKVRLLNNLAFSYYGANPDEGLRCANEALRLARAIGWREGEADAHNKLGINYFIISEFAAALEQQFAARAIYEEIGQRQNIPGVLIGIGNVYHRQGDFAKAIAYFNDALQRNIALGDQRGTAVSLGSLGNVYKAQGDYQQALDYQLRALAIFETLPYKDKLAISFENIGSTYQKAGRYEEALRYYFRALRLAEELGYRGYAGEYLLSIGDTYSDIAGDTAFRYLPADSLLPASRAAALTLAGTYLSRAIIINSEVANRNMLLENYESLSAVAAMQGDYRRALDAYKAYKAIADSVFSTQKSMAISRLETARALALKDKQIELDRLAVAKKRNERVFYVAGIALLLGITIVAVRGRRKSDALLLNILPAAIADELKRKGFAAARQFDAVTVLFTDFVNFTQAGERMSPQALIAELDTCFKAFDDIIGRHGIEKIKTIGDAYLAVAGLPAAHPQHAQRAVQAAIDIRDFMRQRRAAMGEDAFEIRIGVHSGPVVAGIVGVKKFAYDIWGDTVNTAARMEQHSAAGYINISETTYQLVKDAFACAYRGQITAKNKGALKMYYAEPAEV